MLSPTHANLVYLAYGIAILVLPFAILIGLVASRQWKLLGAYAVAGLLAVVSLSIRSNGLAAPNWHFDLSDRLATTLAQFLDDPRWIAMLAAVLTVSGPWLPPGGGAGGGPCCSLSCRFTWWSAPSCRPVRCSAWRSGGSSEPW